MEKEKAVAAKRAQEKAEAEELSVNKPDETGLTNNISGPAAFAPLLS